MKISDLIKAIEQGKKSYPDFLEWNVAVEQHPDYKKCSNCKNNMIISKDPINGETEYLKSHSGMCAGVMFYRKKVFGINIHF